MPQETRENLSDFERKLVTIIQHMSGEGGSPSLKQLQAWTGRDSDEIKETIKALIHRGWLGVQD